MSQFKRSEWFRQDRFGMFIHWGRYTRKGNAIYAHVFEAPIGPLALTGIFANQVEV